MSLEKRLNQVKNRIGLVGGPLIVNEVVNAEQNISASIDPRDWHIELNIAKGWDPAHDKETENYLKQKNISDALWGVTKDLVFHECGHWALPRGSRYGCPRSSELHDIILDGVVQARIKKNRERNEELEHYIANSFEDLLDNSFCKLNPCKGTRTTHSGQVLFYNDQGLNAQKQKYGNFYEAFVKLNMFLWGGSYDEKLLKRFFTNDKKVISAVQEVIKILSLKQKSVFNGKQMQDRAYEQVTYCDKEKVVEMFQNEGRWFEMAFQYAKIMDGLLEQLPQEQLFGVSNSEGGQKDKTSKTRKDSGSSAFDKKLKGDKEKVIVKRFKSGKGKASYMDSFEYLDSLYKSLGREIPVKIELFKQAHSFPVAHYGNEDFDSEVHDLERIRLSKIGVDGNGKIIFQTYRGDITIPAGYVKNLRGFPKLKIINLDTSGSMSEALFGSDVGMIVNPFAPEEQQWGSNSKYHHALVGKYGIDAYFEMQGIAGDVDSILINISSSSIASERQSMENRREENKLALSPQFGNTKIDCDTLEKSLGSETSFVLSLSDGEFFNWDSEKSRFKEIISKHAYAHIQLGSSNDFTSDLQRWGMPVYFVNQENPLEKLMVDVTQKYYQRFALGCLKNE